jgi:hypothetical protein
MTDKSIINQHKIEQENIDGLMFKSDIVEKIVIGFTGMNPDKYDRWSWFYEWFQDYPHTTYIVLRDEEHLFYKNREGNNIEYNTVEFLSKIINDHEVEDIITLGSSMGGYASLYYGCLLKSRLSIASVPLVDKESASYNKYTLWTRKMNELKDNWIDLNEFLKTRDYIPSTFLIHGRFDADVMASDKLTEILSSLQINFDRVQTDNIDHGDFLTKSDLRSLLHDK